MAFREKLAKRARKAGLSPSQDVIFGLEAYFAILGKWNEKVSLTSLPVAEAGEEAIDRLLIEPLLAAKYLPSGTPLVIDIGSGGGSPAVPLKVAAPGIAMVMVESKTRKAAFLREVVRQLGLDRTSVAAARFEALVARPDVAGSADVVTLRAVRVEQKTLAALQRLMKPGGAILLFGTRAGAIEAETRLPGSELKWEGTHSLLPHLNSTLVVFRRTV
ncbi:MAG TPA: 16S rRNA (guanine(527)-N(7))-methyltransferase RsmG [Vicinamibacterales bacterium]|nr:16S rRNA (guanine(527)-N(7))-methyltransferase RsmG [Vicinamibacterales bacterium]